MRKSIINILFFFLVINFMTLIISTLVIILFIKGCDAFETSISIWVYLSLVLYSFINHKIIFKKLME